MKWTEEHDILLCREVLVVQPHQYRPKSTERGNAWTSIANELNAIQEIRFSVTQKAVRDRLKLLVERFKRKLREEVSASGISPDESELDEALNTIIELMDEAEQQFDKDSHEKQKKMEKDRKQAEEIRFQAMETFGESKKRVSEGSEPKQRKKRATGGETLQYLQQKSENEFELRKAELEIKKKEMEDRREVEMSLYSHQQKQFMEFQKNIIDQCHQQQTMIQKQMEQQALNHQQMMASQAQQQQQNNQLLLLLLEKLSKS